MRTTLQYTFQNSSWAIACLFLLFYSLSIIQLAEANTSDALITKAREGSIEDQYNLGKRYLDGKDYKNAGKWLSKAAEQGNVKAQTAMGRMYEKGQGVPKDYGISFSWYEKAANQGYGYAQRSLGKFYELGLGVDPSPEKAFDWYKKAAKQGIAGAQENLGILFETGIGVDKNYQKAVFWYTKTATKGSPRGQYLLGRMYERGFGVEKNSNVAKKWYRKAAASKYSRAIKHLRDLDAKGQKTSKTDHNESPSVSSSSKQEKKPETVSKTATRSFDDTALLSKDLPDPDTTDTDGAKATARYHFEKGNDLFNNGQLIEAVTEYKKSLTYNPRSANTLANLGITYAEMKQYGEAVKTMHEAISANPTNAKTYAALGMMLHFTQNEKEALVQYQNAIKNDPTLGPIYSNMAYIFAKSNDYDRAWKSLYMAEMFKVPNEELRQTLLSESKEPEISWPADEKGYYLRQLVVSTKERALEIRQQLVTGANYSTFVKSDSLKKYKENGGYIGYFEPDEITAQALKSLKNSPPLSYSDVLETDTGFHIFQRLMVLRELYTASE